MHADERIANLQARVEAAPDGAGFEALSSALEEAARWEEWVRLQEKRAERLPDAPEAAGWLAAAAQVAQGRLTDVARAERLFRRALELSPATAGAEAGLRAILLARGELDSAATLLEREALRASGDAAAALWLELAKLHRRRERRDRAALALQRALHAAPGNREALLQLRQASLEAGRLGAAFQILERELDAGASPAELSGPLCALAQRALEQPALHALAKAVAERAVALAAPQPDADAVLAKLAAIEKNFRDELRRTKARAVDERDKRQAARLWLSAAELIAVYDRDVEAPQRWNEALERAFLLVPAMPEALEFLEQRHAGGDPAPLIAAWEKLLAATSAPRPRAELLVRLSALHLTRRGDRARSLELLEEAARLEPSRTDAAWALFEAHTDERRHDRAAEILERHLAALSDRSNELELRLRLAEVYAQRLVDVEKAKRHLEAAQRLEPDAARIDDQLEPILAAEGDREGEARLCERRAARATTPAERVKWLERAAELLPETKPLERMRLLGRALQLEPGRAKARRELEAIAAEAEAPDELVRALRAAAEGAKEVPIRRALQRRIAELLGGALDRPADAAALWRQLAEEDPTDEAARRELEAALQRAGRFHALAEDHRKRLAEATDPAERRALLDGLLERHEQTGEDPAGALELYDQRLALDPEDRAALRRRAIALGLLERWEEQRAAWLALAEKGGEHEPEAREQAAILLAERLGRREEAATELLAGLAKGARPATLAALERLLAAQVRTEEIARALQPHVEATGAPARLAQLLEHRLAATAAADALPVALELAKLYAGALGDPRGAFSALARQLAAHPADEALRAELERLSAELGNAAELAALLRGAAEGAPKESALRLLARVVELARPLGAPELVADALEKLAQLAPEDPAIPAGLAALAEQRERWDEAARQTALQLEKSPAPEHAALHRRRAAFLVRDGKPAEAVRALRAAIAAGAPEAELLGELAPLLEAAGRGDELAEVIERRVLLAREAGDEELASRLTLQRAKLLEGRGARGEAMEHYATILAQRPSDPEAVSVLEKLLDDPSLGARAARALEKSYEAGKEHRKLARAIELQANAAAAPEDRARELRRLAKLYGRELRSPREGFSALLRAFRATPADALLRSELRVAAAEADCLDELASAMADEADGLEGKLPVPQRLALEREIAELFEKRLADPASAVERYERMRALEPESLDALRALHRLYNAQQQWPQLVDACLALAGVVYDEAERLQLQRQAAQLAEEKLTEPAKAAAALRRIAEVIPGDAPTLAALDRLAAKANDPATQAWALDRRIEQQRAPAEAGQEGAAAALRELLFRLAELQRTALAAPERALALHAEVLRGDGRHAGSRAALEAWARTSAAGGVEALALLDPELAKAAEHRLRIELREEQLRHGGPNAARAALFEQIRVIHEVDLAQPSGAFLACCRAFGALTGETDRGRIEPELERLAKATESYEELADLYEETAEAVPGADEGALRLLRRAAQLREVELADAEGALADWQRVLTRAPADRAALDALARLYEARASGTELLAVYEKNADLAAEPTARAEWLVKIGQLAATRLADDARALASLREAHELAPALTTPLEALERIYAKDRGTNGPALREVLEKLAALAPAGTEGRGRWLARRAQVIEERATQQREGLSAAVQAFGDVLQGGDPAGAAGSFAIAQLERLLAQEATKVAAAIVLEPIFRARGDDARLAAALDARLSALPPGNKERGPLLEELAAKRERLGEAHAAFVATASLFREDPSAEAVRERLVRLARETGSLDELAGLLEDEVERRGDADEVALQLLAILAPLCAGPLGRASTAAQAWERLAAARPADPGPLDELGKLYRQKGQLRELADVLARKAARADSPATKRELYAEMATLMEEQLSDRDGAIEAFRKILAIDEADADALQALGRLLGEAQRWDELAALLATQIERAKAAGLEPEARELTHKLGRIRQLRLADPDGAAKLYAEVLASEPRHARTLAALEEMARSDSPQARALAATLLAPVYEDEGNFAQLVQALRNEAAVAPAGAAKAALLGRVAEVYAGPLESADMAFLAASEALAEEPDAEAWAALACRCADAAGELGDELVEKLSEAADEARSDEAKLRLRREIAKRLERAGEATRARDEWKKVRGLSPDDTDALDALARLHAGAGDTEAYLEALRAKLARTEEAGPRRDALFAIAVAQEEKQKDLSAAIGSLRRLLELAPNDLDALLRMDQLCIRTERWTDLADVLARQERAASLRNDGRARVEALFRLAQLKETRLLDRDGAVELFAQVLELAPDHGETVARLSGIVAKDPGHGEAAALLERAHLHAQNWPKYADALDARAQATTDGPTRKQLFSQLAEVREKRQGRSDLAFIAYTRAFREDPSDVDLRVAMERTADAADAVDALVGAYEDELPKVRNNVTAAEIALRIGLLFETRLDDETEALKWLERARELDAEVGLKALPSLERLLRQAGRFPDLADVLEVIATRAAEPTESVATWFRLGQLAEERLAAPDRAAEAYEKILVHEPRHLPALRALEKLYDQAGRFDRLYENLSTQRELTPEGTARDRLTGRLAEVAAQGLKDREKAIFHYQEVLARNPRSEGAQLGLEGLYDDTGRWQELAELLRTRLTTSVDPREINRLNDKLGFVLGTKLGSTEEAQKSFQAVLERDPKNRKALEALREIHATRGDKEPLAGILRRLVPLQDDAAGVKDVRLALAETLAELGRREEAIENAKRTLDLEPHDRRQLVRAAELFARLSAWPEVIRASELHAGLLDREAESDEAIALWREVSRIQEEKLSRAEGAAAAMERVLELRPSDREAFERVRLLYRSVADWRRYAAATERFASQPLEIVEKLALLVELADVHEQRLGQKDIAFTKLAPALEADPANDEVRHRLLRLADETNSNDALAGVYEEVADAALRGPLAAELYLELARLQDEKLDEKDDAEATLRKILDFDPVNGAALDALARLFGRRGDDKRYVVALEQKLEAVATLEEKRNILHEIARVQDEKLSATPDAVYSLRRALEMDPGDRGTLEALAAIYRRDRRFPELAALLAQTRDSAGDPVERAALQLQLAELTERELADDEAALSAYALALEIDPGSLPALDALERLYTKLDRSAELLRVYDRKMDLVEEPRERAKLLFKAAAIWEEKFSDAANAIACLEGVLALDPDSLPAVKGLENLFRQEEDWERLIRACELHVALIEHDTSQNEELVDLHVKIGDVLYKELGRVDRAEQSYARAIELDPGARRAMSGLGRLYERSGNWPLALEMLQREARLAGGGKDAVELWYRQGRIHEEMLQDGPSAKAAYKRALELSHEHLPSIRALRGVYEAEADWDGFLEMLEQEATVTEDAPEKARLWGEVGRFHLERREDRDAAQKAFEEARKNVAYDLIAARALADLYIAKEAWAQAEEALDVVCQNLADDGTPEAARELTQRVYRLGFVAEKQQKIDKALASYRKSYELDPSFLPAAEGLAHLLVVKEEWSEARNVYQAILIHHRDDLTDPEVVEIHWSIGDLRHKLSDVEAAQKSFKNALELDPYHAESHKSLVQLLELQGRWDESFEHRQKLCEILDGRERFDVLVSTAEVARTRLSDPYQAIDDLQTALKLDPEAAQVMETLLVLYKETRQAQKAIEMVERLLGTPATKSDREKSITLRIQLAEAFRDAAVDDSTNLKRAVEHFNGALDLDWRRTQAFSALEQMLGKARDWRGLEANYVRMLQRLPKEDGTKGIRVLLWRTLGDLYLNALKQPGAALDAYKAVTLLAPDDAPAAETYAELLAQKPGAENEAVEAFRKAMSLSASPEKAARSLVLLHAKRKDFDKAYVTSEVVVHVLGGGGADEQGILAKLQKFTKISAAKQMTDRMWTESLYHEKLRGPVAEIMALMHEHAGALFAHDHGSLEIQGKPVRIDRKRDRVDVSQSMLFFVNAYKYVARTFGMEALELYKVPGLSGLVVANTFPVCLVAGEDMFTDQRPKKELYFYIGKNLAFSRPELVMARLHRPETLDFLLQAAVSLGEPRFRVTLDAGEVDKIRKRLERSLSPAAAQALQKLAFQYTRDPSKPDLRSYIEGVELTATRAGVLLSSDVQVAYKCVTADKGTAAPLRPLVKQRDLLVFCLSDAFFALRQSLGLAVEIPRQ